jgi:pyruvate-formate lyase
MFTRIFFKRSEVEWKVIRKEAKILAKSKARVKRLQEIKEEKSLLEIREKNSINWVNCQNRYYSLLVKNKKAKGESISSLRITNKLYGYEAKDETYKYESEIIELDIASSELNK